MVCHCKYLTKLRVKSYDGCCFNSIDLRVNERCAMSVIICVYNYTCVMCFLKVN